MIIESIPDIVLQATQAADPGKRAQALDTLRKAAAGTVASGQIVETDVQSWPEAIVRAAEDPAPPAIENARHYSTATYAGVTGSTERKEIANSPAMKFEAFVLQTFIATMLPKESESVFGSGTSGDIWRSMLAEHIANEVARTGGIGIARVIDKGAA